MFIKKKVETNNAPRAIGPYSQALVVGNRVYLSGQLGLDPRTMDFVSDDVVEQTRQTLTNIKAILEAAGSDMDHVVKVEIYLTDLSYFPAVNEIFAEFFQSDNPPVRQTIAVRGIPRDGGVLISCEAILRNYVDPNTPNPYILPGNVDKMA